MKVEFINVGDVRMASPFGIAEKVVVHGWPKKFPKRKFQDKYVYDPQKEICVLIKWDIDKRNNPGFKPILLFNESKRQVELNRVKGCCKSVMIEGDKIILEVFRLEGDLTIEINLNEIMT